VRNSQRAKGLALEQLWQSGSLALWYSDPVTRRLVLSPVFVLAALICLGQAHAITERVQTGPTFAAHVASLSEAGGYFDTDNLISNERSYLEVIPDLRRASGRGGAYVGVGPDQNFSYIAAVRPSIAFIIDIRRDNLLLHLLFKALFHVSRTRVDYLARLVGRPVPLKLDGWRDASIERVVSYIDGVKPEPRSTEALRARVMDTIARFGIPLSREDADTIDRFHRRFVAAGLDLRFHSSGRLPQNDYPTYRELLLTKDPEGRAGNYLADEDAFQAVKALQMRDLVIPVVGNLSGPSAMAAIGKLLTERREPLAAFYSSNVEFYLFGDGTFRDFTANLRRIPHTSRSVIIRSVFGRDAWRYSRTGFNSSSHTQSVTGLLDAVQNGRIRSYRDLIEP
jgi:hypothetical protein